MPSSPNGRNQVDITIDFWFRNLSLDAQQFAKHKLDNSLPFQSITMPVRNNVFATFFDNYFMNEIDFAKLKALVVKKSSSHIISNIEVAKGLFLDDPSFCFEPDSLLISADNFELPVKRLQMSKYSDFILVAYYNSFYIESQRNMIHLTQIKIEPLLATLIFLKEHCKTEGDKKIFNEMHLSTCLNIFNVASFLQINIVLQSISKLILKRVSTKTLVLIYEIAVIRHTPLAQRLWGLMIKNFKVLVNKNRYLQLTAKQLVALLKEPFLNIKPDEEISLVRQWLKVNKNTYPYEELKDLHKICFRLEDIQNSTKCSYFIKRIRYPQTILMAVGGWDANGPINELEFYEPNRQVWMKVHEKASISLKENRAYHGLVLKDEQMYVLGGFDGRVHHNSLHKLNLNTKEWSIMAPMKEKRCYVSSALLNSNKIFVAGGFNDRQRIRSAEIMDIERNQWTNVASMHTVRSDADCVTIGDKCYMIGGFNGITCHNSGEFYDPIKNAWFPMIKNMILKRSGLKAVAIGGVIFVTGGFTGSLRIKSTEFYDPREGKWHTLKEMNIPRSNFGIETLDSTNVLVCGGYNERITNFSEQYEWRTNQWKATPSMSTEKSALTLCRINRYKIIEEFVDEYDYRDEISPLFF